MTTRPVAEATRDPETGDLILAAADLGPAVDAVLADGFPLLLSRDAEGVYRVVMVESGVADRLRADVDQDACTFGSGADLETALRYALGAWFSPEEEA